VRLARHITPQLSVSALVSARQLNTIVDRTIVFIARMIVAYSEAHGTVRARKQPREGLRASVKERP
jgi:hypothetical protein